MSEQKQPTQKIKKKKNPGATDETQWGESSSFGYRNEDERKDRRGLEDWEMLSSMEQSTVGIPFWFVAIFIVLLIVAVGLTFPFWGNRPGYERPWFDWGIPAGVAWVVVMSAVIYYFVEMRPAKAQRLALEAKDAQKKEAVEKEQKQQVEKAVNDKKNK